MKKIDKFPKNFKKTPIDFHEHKELASDLIKAQEILEPWMDRFYLAYSVNGKEVKNLHSVLKLLSSIIRFEQDYHWSKLHIECSSLDERLKSPYYRSGKCGWI
jgi:hypothetical protein